MAVTRVPVSAVTGLHSTVVAPTSVTLFWKPPTKGTPPIRYVVFYRKAGESQWTVGSRTKNTAATITPLHPATSYEFEIFCLNTEVPIL